MGRDRTTIKLRHVFVNIILNGFLNIRLWVLLNSYLYILASFLRVLVAPPLRIGEKDARKGNEDGGIKG